MPGSDAPAGPDPGNRSGGGIVFGGGQRSTASPTASATDAIAGFRRRWAGGIAVVTVADGTGGWRGVTVTSLMVVSLEPAVLAVALTASGSFQEFAMAGTLLGVSVLEASHDFAAERFAGRAPLPDARFSGVAHHLESGVPVLDGALAWCVGRVRQRDEIGDHVLFLLEVLHGGLGADTDDPLLSYEGRYRRLEAG